jgi:hypothetical protein
VCAAGFVRPLRLLAGIDDVLAERRQLRLIPRLPWQWKALHVNDWPVRYRDEHGDPKWTRLWFTLERSLMSARLRIRTAHSVPGLEVRLGPFPLEAETGFATVDGHDKPARLEASGNAKWIWMVCDSHAADTLLEARTQSGKQAPASPAQE